MRRLGTRHQGPSESKIDRAKAYYGINDSAKSGHVSENAGDQIKVEQANKAPVKPSHN